MKIIVAFMVLVSVGVASAQVRVKENLKQATVMTELPENVKKLPPVKKK